MKKIFSAILMIVLLAGGSPASAQEPQTSQLSELTEGGTLEPLTQFDYKNPWSVVTDGRYAYVDSLFDPGAEVMVLDYFDPVHPVEIASIPIESDNQILAVANSMLYVGKTWDGIFIYNVSTPTDPYLIGQFNPTGDMSPNQMVISGSLAYVADLTLGLAVLNISDPAHPALLGANTEESLYRLAVQGQNAYALAHGRLIIYDVSKPAEPTLLGRYENMSRWGEAVAVFGDIAYLSGSLRDGQNNIIGYFTDVIDVSNPSQPERVTELQQLAVPVKQLIEKDELLYAVRSDGLAIYNLTDPLDPQLFGMYPSYWGMSMELQENQALLLDNVTGLHVLDITDPAHPLQIGFYGWPQEADYLTSAGTNLFSVRNNAVPFPTYEDRSIVRVINAANPVDARVIGYLVLDDKALGKPFVDGSYLYFAGNRGVTIIDASNPGNLRIVARTGNSFTSVVEVQDDLAYSISMDLGGSGGYFTISDVSNPVSPTLLSQSIYLNPKDLSITSQGENTYAYIITNRELVVLDVTDPVNPSEVYRDTPGIGYGLIDTENRGSQTIAYLTGSISDWNKLGIMTMDVSDPAHPVYLGTFLQSNIYGTTVLQAKDGLMYFSDDNELVLVDFSDPAHPHQVSSARDPGGNIMDASAGDHYLYTTVGWGSITVFSMTGDLSGQVTDHNYNAFAEVTLTLNTGQETQTGADGAYIFPDLGFGDYVVTPTLGSYVFAPARRMINIPSDWVSQNFVILPAPVSSVLEPGITSTLTFTDVQGLPTSFIFPSGLVSTTATALVTPTLATGFFGNDFAGHAFELAIDAGVTTNPEVYFTVPVSVTIHYSLDDTAGITNTARLALYRSDGSSWVDVGSDCVPTSSAIAQVPGIFEGAICQEGLYALLGPAYSVALPLVSFGTTATSCEPPDCNPLPPLSGQE